MDKSNRSKFTEMDFLNTLDDLDQTIRKAQLIHKIELKARESEAATPEQLTRIQHEIKQYREQIRLLG